MPLRLQCSIGIIAFLTGLFVTAALPAKEPAVEQAQTVRCAVIGGMMDTGFWPELSKRFETATGHRVEVVAKGTKHTIAGAFVRGEADLITMHASDTMVNLVADGYGIDPQPWTRNDLILAGPKSDPAGIRGMTDAAGAMRKIAETKSIFLIQRSLGAQQVLFDLPGGRAKLDWQHVDVQLNDEGRQVLVTAAKKNAYVLLGRIPFFTGRIPNGDMEIMVQGDPRLRRPYLVVTAAKPDPPDARALAARRLAAYLRSPQTQQWIGQYGRGRFDDRQLFFPVTLPDRVSCDGTYGCGPKALVVATGSPGELGFLRVIAEEFAGAESATVLWKKAGSGRSLELLHGGKADVAMVHAPEAEKKAVAEGWAVRRTLIGSNEFFLVGPANDPAGVRSAKSAHEAYRRIAAARSRFLSRGDNSGTHKRELAIWKKAGIVPDGSWYVTTSDFMAATLRRANAEKAYFMTDSSTWVVLRDDLPNLGVLFRGDPLLVNVYHALCRPEEASSPDSLGAKFVDFLAEPKSQGILRDFGKKRFGESLYRDADYAKKLE